MQQKKPAWDTCTAKNRINVIYGYANHPPTNKRIMAGSVKIITTAIKIIVTIALIALRITWEQNPQEERIQAQKSINVAIPETLVPIRREISIHLGTFLTIFFVSIIFIFYISIISNLESISNKKSPDTVEAFYFFNLKFKIENLKFRWKRSSHHVLVPLRSYQVLLHQE